MKKITYLIIIILLLTGCSKKITKEKEYYYLASDTNDIILYDNNKKEVSLTRGSEVELIAKGDYYKVKLNNNEYLVSPDNLTKTKDNIIKEQERYVRTSLTLYEDSTTSKILGYIKKGSKVEIIGYDKLLTNGQVNKYKVKYSGQEGYVYSKYLSDDLSKATISYNYNNANEIHGKMGSSLGGGKATTLDYYPYEKGDFKNNVMPSEVRALYINSSAIKNVDAYIAFAKESNINAFVVDIKDNTSPAYPAKAMKKYSITNYNKAINTYEDYQKYIKKLKDNGFYVIGRITVFKDSYFVKDHPEVAIKDKNGKPLKHNNSYWPSAYNRLVWEFNVELAKESSKEMGFNEIQFDYVRFPDRTMKLELNKQINFENVYNESKAEALQMFCMYATDELHLIDTYVSVDVFGESAHDYVTAYGQYWPAISNIVDVISGMPYPDHFNPHQYGIKEVVWTNPYKLLNYWGSLVAKKQALIPTPAKVRTWIQAYNTNKSPSVIYDTNKINEQIDGLYNNGLTGGYMTWNSGSNLDKYKELKEAFKKERINE